MVYFVADVLDTETGSSYGIAILGKVVTIVPLSNPHPFSLMKLVGRIQEILGEGEISFVDGVTGEETKLVELGSE